MGLLQIFLHHSVSMIIALPPSTAGNAKIKYMGEEEGNVINCKAPQSLTCLQYPPPRLKILFMLILLARSVPPT